MSINKKLGGIRLRLATGITAALALCGVVLALNAPKSKPSTLAIEFATEYVVGGEANVVLFVSGGNDLDTYYLRPKDMEASDDTEGWALEDVGRDGNGTTDMDPAILDDDDTPPAIQFQTEDGEAIIYLKTAAVNELDEEKESRIELRTGSATASTVDAYDDMLILSQS